MSFLSFFDDPLTLLWSIMIVISLLLIFGLLYTPPQKKTKDNKKIEK